MSSFLGGGGSGGGGGGTPGGSNTDIQFNNSGSFGGDANFTWTIGSGEINLLSYALGNFAALGTQTLAPGDPVNVSTQNAPTIFSENNYLAADLSSGGGFVQGASIFNGYKHTGTGFGDIFDVTIGPTINSDSTGPIHEFYTLYLEPEIYSSAPIDNFRPLVINSFVVGSGAPSEWFGMWDTSHNFTSGNIQNWYGVFENLQHGGTGTVTNMVGILSDMVVSGGGAVTNFIDFRSAGLQTTLTGTITNYIGVQIDDHSGVGGTLSLNLWSQGASSINRFDGILLFGHATNGSPVDGDLWYDGTHFFFRKSTTSIDLLSPSASLTIGTTPISGSTGNDVLYGDGTVLQQASVFQITSGQPNVTLGSAYLYNSKNAVFQVAATDGNGDDWFVGGAGNFSLTGGGNFCEGPGAGAALTTGFWNMVEGFGALAACTTGHGNLAFGRFAAHALVDGQDNVAMGSGALSNATTGCSFNFAMGVGAMGSGALTGATNNIAIGNTTGQSLTSAGSAVVVGGNSLQNATAIFGSVVIGASAANSVGASFQLFENVIIGFAAAPMASGFGNYNIIIGPNAGGALTNGGFNTILSANEGTISTGQQNVAIGYGAGVPNGGNSGQLSIANIIYGTNNTGTGSTPSTGQIGLGIVAPTATLHLAPSTTAQANLRFDPTSAAAPSSPNDGDMWYDGTNLKFRQGGTTHTIV